MDIKDMVELGKCQVDEGHYEEAYPYFLEAALAGEPEAVKQLAQLYLFGDGVEIDYKKAFHYFKVYYDLCGKIGYMWPIAEARTEIISSPVGRKEYSDMLDYLESKEEWTVYISKADEYSKGGIYPKNAAKKLDCLKIALRNGVRFAAELIGQMYFEGDEIPQDYEKAYRHFTMYEGEESFTKLYYLGEMYLNGLYVQQDTEKAKQLYESIVYSEAPMKSIDEFYYKAAERLHELNTAEGEGI